MIKARLAIIITALSVLCACAGPSVRYKKDISSMMDNGNYEGVEVKIKEGKNKHYGEHNALLYYLDLSTPQTALYDNTASNQSLAAAQDVIEDLQVKSITQGLGTLIINDNTQPYRAPVFEQALTYFYRAMDYLYLSDHQSAVVEARKAVFFLDNVREKKEKGFNDDPFVQYFASMLFEDSSSLSSARIARANAKNAYEKDKAWSNAKAPDFPLPSNWRDMGEVVVFHYNGKVPYRISNSIIFAWNDVWFAVNGNGDLNGVGDDVISAVYAGAFGRSITISFPALQDNPYIITASSVSVPDGEPIKTQLVSDIAQNAKASLKEQLAGDYTRTIIRAVTKYILSVQAKHAATKIANDETVGEVVGAIFSVFSNITEKADTRSWFTLPAEIRMADMFLEPGSYDITMKFYDNRNQTIDEHVFEKVQIIKGQRIYLYYRTSK